MTLLTFNSKYVVASTTAASTTSTSLVDDPYASQTFTLGSTKVVLVIYQAYGAYAATNPSSGIQNAINIDGVDRANSWDAPYGSYFPVRNCVFWVGTLGTGSHTIKGRFASNSADLAATISNRVLLIYIFDGDEFQYIDDATTVTTTSATLVDDPYTQVVFTPSDICKALMLYNATNSGATETYYGKKVAIYIGGTDYAQAEKSTYGNDYVDSVFTVHALSLSPVSTTVRGRFASNYSGNTVSIHRRQFAVLLLADSTLLDIVTSTTQVSTTSNKLVDDPQATISRTTTDARELLVIAMGTKRSGTSSSYFGECYGIQIDGNDRANSRGSPYNSAYANSAATAYAERLVAGSHTVKGRFSNNYYTTTAVISARQVVALWFSGAVGVPYTVTVTDSMGVVDWYSKTVSFTRVFTDCAVGEHSFVPLHGREFRETVKSVDWLLRGIAVCIYDFGVGLEYLRKLVVPSLLDAGHVSDYMCKAVSKLNRDVSFGLEYLRKSVVSSILEVSHVSDWVLIPQRMLVTVFDSLFPEFVISKDMAKVEADSALSVDWKLAKDVVRYFVDYVVSLDRAFRVRIVEVFDRVLHDFDIAKEMSKSPMDRMVPVDVVAKVAYTLMGYGVRRVYSIPRPLADIIESADHNTKILVCQALIAAVKSLKDKLSE